MLKTVRATYSRLSAPAAALLACTAIPPAAAQTAPPRPHRSHHAHHPANAARPSPAAPTPAPVAANATTPAPVPNEAVTPPLDRQAPSASVAPSVFQLHYPPQGEGYVTGSSPQAMDDRNAAKATGVQATVPLPQ